MATKSMKLKSRRSPTSTVLRGRVNTRMRRGNMQQIKQKSAATATSPKSNKLTSVNKVNLKSNLIHKQKKSSQPKRASASHVGNASSTPKDEYEFDGTDDYISSDSFTSGLPLSGKSNLKKQTKPATDAIASKKSRASNKQDKLQVSKDQKTKQVDKRQEQKKTSTPILTESVNSRKSGRVQQTLRNCRVSLPRLDFDMSITPILTSPKQKARQSINDKSVSFVEESKTSKPQATPLLPGVKSGHPRKSPRKGASKTNEKVSVSVNNPASTVEKQNLTTVSVVLNKVNLKRKTPQSSDSSDVDAVPSKRKKTEVIKSQSVSLTPKQKHPKKPNNTKTKNKPEQKQACPKQSKLPFTPRSPRQVKPVTSTPIDPSEEQPLEVKKQGKEKKDRIPYDSGISMGDDMSSNRETTSSAGLSDSVLGFMEDEPVKSQFDELTSSSLSTSNEKSTSDPASTLNKSVGRQYKVQKTKREKGRFSTSRVDAWADAVNQSLDDVESFELFVE